MEIPLASALGAVAVARGLWDVGDQARMAQGTAITASAPWTAQNDTSVLDRLWPQRAGILPVLSAWLRVTCWV